MAGEKQRKYVSDNAQLMLEWNWEKNGTIDPKKITIGSNKMVWWRCINGHEWEAAVKNRSHGSQCPYCYHLSQKGKPSKNGLQKTHDMFMADLAKRNPNKIIVVGQYVTARDQIEWECQQCGTHLYSLPKHLYSSSGLCKKCLTEKLANKMVQDTKLEFLSRFNNRQDAPNLLEEYKGMLTPIKVQCNICGHVWNATPNNLLRYAAPCPECAKKKRIKEHVSFIEELRIKNPYIKVLGKYVTSHTALPCECLLCGHIWNPKPYVLLNGIGCPNCNHNSTSFIEQLILHVLRITFPQKEILSRDQSAIGQELDIYIPEDHVAIEYGAWHWHKDRTHLDDQKVQLCNHKGIRLITIYDSCKESATNLEKKDVLYYKADLARNIHEAQKMLLELFDFLDYTYTLTNEQFEFVINEAYISSRKKTTLEFICQMGRINANIEVLGEYRGAQQTIKCRCKVCGYIWEPVPSSLAAGSGCPKCSNHITNKLTPEQYEEKLNLKHPNIKILDTYTTGRDEKHFMCTTCGFIWLAKPKAVLSGRGCKKCNIKAAAKKRVKNARKKNEDSLN